MAPRRFQEAPSTRKVFLFIKARVESGEDWPTGAEIARHMGWKYSGSCRDTLTRLVRRGVIAYTSQTKVNSKDWRYTYRLTGKELDE